MERDGRSVAGGGRGQGEGVRLCRSVSKEMAEGTGVIPTRAQVHHWS